MPHPECCQRSWRCDERECSCPCPACSPFIGQAGRLNPDYPPFSDETPLED